ncbi:cathepsin D-like [Alosa alosa]|nr:cathepsin D-like [Alosa alosa]XP_048101245.1 cathepsin D-like [Alosa alosa]XP_048101246.1 cathepsin D-like [Alosa alosa]
MALKLLPLNIISHYFNSHTGLGELMLGGTNPDHCEGELHYVPVADKSNWQIPLERISVGRNLTLCEEGCRASLQTCAKGIFGPADDINALHTAIGAKPSEKYGAHTVKCHGMLRLPIISFNLGGKVFILSPLDYIKRVEVTPRHQHQHKLHVCVSRFHAHRRSLHGEQWVLGETFLHHLYTVFDRDQDRVGFAPLKRHNSGPKPHLPPGSAADGLPESLLVG